MMGIARDRYLPGCCSMLANESMYVERIFTIVYRLWVYLLALLCYNYFIDKQEFDEEDTTV